MWVTLPIRTEKIKHICNQVRHPRCTEENGVQTESSEEFLLSLLMAPDCTRTLTDCRTYADSQPIGGGGIDPVANSALRVHIASLAYIKTVRAYACNIAYSHRETQHIRNQVLKWRLIARALSQIAGRVLTANQSVVGVSALLQLCTIPLILVLVLFLNYPQQVVLDSTPEFPFSLLEVFLFLLFCL